MFPDIEDRPSTHHRFNSASRDIRQHREYNFDWEDAWIFDDECLLLRSGPGQLFVHFLSQMLHPLVRSDQEEVERLLVDFNPDARGRTQMLEADDWELVEVGQISGRPIYEGRRREAIRPLAESIDIDAYENLLTAGPEGSIFAGSIVT